MAALDATTGALLWNANADGDVRALALSSDGSQLLAGGAFAHVGGVTHRKLASLNPATGAAATTWKASASGTVRDIVVVGGTAYFGGVFTSQNGVSQHGLGAVTVTTGKVVATFNTTTDSKVYALATNGARLFFGGDFTTVNGQPRASLASVTLATGTLDAWSPTRACSACNLYWDLALDGTHLFAASRNAGPVTSVDTSTAHRAWTQNANGDAHAHRYRRRSLCRRPLHQDPYPHRQGARRNPGQALGGHRRGRPNIPAQVRHDVPRNLGTRRIGHSAVRRRSLHGRRSHAAEQVPVLRDVRKRVAANPSC